ncbi:MAG: hypothetical protein ABJJ25_11800 [Eudoraea sp.]|uniref:hypothetical protein n=1 Tax=Eudoraea sp. TaxID=1979955 RepID=UPI003266B61B
MMDELELLKKDWQKKEEHHPKLSYDQIYRMIKKKSSSTVKWIFYISIIEFVFWAILNLFSYTKESLELEKTWHVYEITTALTIINYIVLIYFIYKFYSNYKLISITESSKKLMKNILNVKRTVTQYVWFNIGIFVAYLIVSLYGNLNYGVNSEKIAEAASQAGNEMIFWVMLTGMVLVAITIVLLLIWFFYKLLYGILLRRLRKNYNELKKLEV